MYWMATRLSLSNCALSAPQCLMHAGCWLSRAHLPFDRFCFSSCWVTCHPPQQHRAGGRAGVDTDHSSMRQVLLGYNVTSSRVLNPDLTEKSYWKQKRHWGKGLPSWGLIVHFKCVSSAIGSDGCLAWGFMAVFILEHSLAPSITCLEWVAHFSCHYHPLLILAGDDNY